MYVSVNTVVCNYLLCILELYKSQNNALTALNKFSHLFALSHSLRDLAQNLRPRLPSRIAFAMTK